MDAVGIVVAVVALLVVAVVTTGVVLRRRRRNRSRDAATQARLAIRQMSREHTKSRKGSIRGKGQGGDRGTALDTAYGSDTSSGA